MFLCLMEIWQKLNKDKSQKYKHNRFARSLRQFLKSGLKIYQRPEKRIKKIDEAIKYQFTSFL